MNESVSRKENLRLIPTRLLVKFTNTTNRIGPSKEFWDIPLITFFSNNNGNLWSTVKMNHSNNLP